MVHSNGVLPLRPRLHVRQTLLQCVFNDDFVLHRKRAAVHRHRGRRGLGADTGGLDSAVPLLDVGDHERRSSHDVQASGQESISDPWHNNLPGNFDGTCLPNKRNEVDHVRGVTIHRSRAGNYTEHGDHADKRRDRTEGVLGSLRVWGILLLGQDIHWDSSIRLFVRDHIGVT